MADAGANPKKAEGIEQAERRARDSMPRWYRIAAIVATTALLLVANIGYTTYVDGKRAISVRDADRRWCQLLTTLDEAYSTVPPTTELGRRVATAIHELRTELDC